VIEVRSLTKSYGDRRAVDELTFTAPAGRVTGFLGPNGAGKTTTFRCLLGLAAPSSGEALFDGRPYRELASPRRQVGAVLESVGYHPARRGRDHLRVLARSAGLDGRRIDAVLDTVGLAGAAGRPVGGYSLGMRQRLGLAGALLGDPPVVVLDEPSNGLDPEGVRWVRQLLRVWADEGRTVLVSSHQLAEIAQVIDRVVIVRDGAAVVETDVAALADRQVSVRAEPVAPLLEALSAAGVEHRRLPDATVAVGGLGPDEVGRIAAGAGVVVTELTRPSPVATLEALFMGATGDGVAGDGATGGAEGVRS
jgi:ABC-2 type transport system ATP-binding protein